MRARGGEGEQLLVARQPAQPELHAEHERERHRDDEEVRRKRDRDAAEVGERHRAPEDDLVELEELEDDEQLQDRQEPHPERDEDLAQHEAIEQRHRGAL